MNTESAANVILFFLALALGFIVHGLIGSILEAQDEAELGMSTKTLIDSKHACEKLLTRDKHCVLVAIDEDHAEFVVDNFEKLSP